jgi:xylulokinase
MMRSTVLAIDLGGTSLRAALLTGTGETVALHSAAHSIGVEADARVWWDTLRGFIAALPQRPAAIALSGFTRSQVLVDAAGQPVRPAQCFPDGRASDDGLAGAAEGTWSAMSPFHPVARLCWVRQHDPAALARARHVLQPKDYLALCLTGVAASDPIANAWAVDRVTGQRTDRPLRAAGLDPDLLPPFLAPTERVGFAVRIGWPDVPVFTGSMDTWVASVGAGVGMAGDAYIISGTTDAGGVLTAQPEPRPGLVTVPWNGVFHTGGPSGAGADCLAWAATLLGVADVTDVIQLAAGSREPPLFLPSLSGTRAPGWNPAARGALLGLRRAHGPADITRAVLEGVAFADAALFGGLPMQRVVLAGGGARSDLWSQIRADVFAQPVLRTPGETGLLGAAAVAWTGLGHFASLADAQKVLCQQGCDRFEPRDDPALRERHAAWREAQP